jgi:hypothetical protein
MSGRPGEKKNSTRLGKVDMDIARFLGILIVFGVPAIWIGGLFYHWFGSWVAVWIWEVVLIIIALNVALKATRNSASESH